MRAESQQPAVQPAAGKIVLDSALGKVTALVRASVPHIPTQTIAS
jgi:hypothetical protein